MNCGKILLEWSVYKVIGTSFSIHDAEVVCEIEKKIMRSNSFAFGGTSSQNFGHICSKRALIKFQYLIPICSCTEFSKILWEFFRCQIGMKRSLKWTFWSIMQTSHCFICLAVKYMHFCWHFSKRGICHQHNGQKQWIAGKFPVRVIQLAVQCFHEIVLCNVIPKLQLSYKL